jgi:outer membrane protein assembly factor BamB
MTLSGFNLDNRRIPGGIFTMRTTLLRILCVLVLLTVCCLQAENWPQFRGPIGLGYTAQAGLPMTWNAKSGENIKWKTPLTKCDNAYSSPVVWGNKIFLTTAKNNPLEHHVLCFQTRDGKLLWDSSVQPGHGC